MDGMGGLASEYATPLARCLQVLRWHRLNHNPSGPSGPSGLSVFSGQAAAPFVVRTRDQPRSAEISQLNPLTSQRISMRFSV